MNSRCHFTVPTPTASALPTMPRHLSLFALATLAWATCLVGLSWLAAAWLGRALSLAEWVLLGLALVVVLAVIVRGYRQRNRRRLQDMRDSALW